MKNQQHLLALNKTLKIAVFALLLGIIAVPAQAQRRTIHYLANYENEPYHFGFLLAYNQMMYTIKTVDNYQSIALPTDSWPDGGYTPGTACLYVYNLETKQTPGFTVGIIGSKRLGRYFDLRFIPTLSFSDRQLVYTIATEDQNGHIAILPKGETKAIFTTFVEFPLNIKYRSKRYNNIGAYLMGGINPKIDLASQKENRIPIIVYDDNGDPMTDGGGNIVTQEIINNFVTKRFDCALEIGTGFDIYNQWFKMGIEVKMSYGLLDVIKRSPGNDKLIYSSPIDKISNKMFQFSILIE